MVQGTEVPEVVGDDGAVLGGVGFVSFLLVEIDELVGLGCRCRSRRWRPG